MNLLVRTLIVAIVVALISLTVLIIISAGSDKQLTQPEPEEKENRTITRNESDALFARVNQTFGIRDSLIKSLKKKQPAGFEIRIPANIPLTLYVKEMFQIFEPYAVTIISEEREMNTFATLQVRTIDSTLLYLELRKGGEQSAQSGIAALCILIPPDISDQDLDALLREPEPFTLLLTPSKKNSERISKILNERKNIGLYLNDEISERQYKLASDATDFRMTRIFDSYKKDLRGSRVVLIDDTSELFTGGMYSRIKKELTKRDISLFTYADFFMTGGENSEEISQSITSRTDDIIAGNPAIFLIKPEDVPHITDAVASLKKKGVKIQSAQSILITDK